MAKAKPETVTATDETTLPLEVLPEAAAPVAQDVDIPQVDIGNPILAEVNAPAAFLATEDGEFNGDAPMGEPVADEQITYVVEGNAEGGLTFTPVAPAPEAPTDPVTYAPGQVIYALPPVPSDAEIADPVALPDAKLLRNLIAAIETRNTDLHRPALWTELERAGAVVESGRLVLAGVSAAGEGQRKGMLANWTNAARRTLMEMGNV